MNPGALAKLIAPLRRRVSLMVGRCVVNIVNDALKMQGVQISLLTDETRDNVERLQNYGFTSNPKPGAEAVALAVGGTRNHAVVIACDDRRYRLTGLASGEVAMYTDEGDKIVLKRGRIIEITAGTKIRCIAPLVEMTGDLDVTGNTTLHGTLHVVGVVTADAALNVAGTIAGSGNITAGASVTAAGDVKDAGGAKSMAGMRTVYNTHAHLDPQGGSSSAPTTGM